MQKSRRHASIFARDKEQFLLEGWYGLSSAGGLSDLGGLGLKQKHRAMVVHLLSSRIFSQV